MNMFGDIRQALRLCGTPAGIFLLRKGVVRTKSGHMYYCHLDIKAASDTKGTAEDKAPLVTMSMPAHPEGILGDVVGDQAGTAMQEVFACKSTWLPC